MGAAALTHFFTQERWRLEHKEPTAPLVISPMTGGLTGGAQETAHRLGGCSMTELSLLPTWAKSQERLGALWWIQRTQTGYCKTHLVTPPSRADPDHSRTRDLLAQEGGITNGNF